MTTQMILVAVGAAIVSAFIGYVAGTRIRGRQKQYKAAFIGIVVGTVGVLTLGFSRGESLVVAVALGCGFGLLNGLRHGFTRPFEGLTSGSLPNDLD